MFKIFLSEKNLLSIRLFIIASSFLLSFFSLLFILYMVNNSVIGGQNYNEMKRALMISKEISTLKSNFYNLATHIYNITNDETESIEKIELTTEKIDSNFNSLLLTVKNGEDRKLILAAQANWFEYKQTLTEEIIPAGEDNNQFKINYLMSGIEHNRATLINTNIERVSN